jgi:hypothetical protein
MTEVVEQSREAWQAQFEEADGKLKFVAPHQAVTPKGDRRL